MTFRLVPAFALALALGTLAGMGGLHAVARADGAGLPDPREVQFDPVVVANASGTAIGGSPAGFDVVVRIPYPTPWPGRFVSLEFDATPMKLHNSQHAGTTLDCAARLVGRVTDAGGAVNFALRASGFDNTNAIRVLVDGVQYGAVRGRSTDLDGIDGRTGLNDFAIFGENYLTQASAVETDFDLNGTTGLGDFALFGAEFLGGAVGTYCP